MQYDYTSKRVYATLIDYTLLYALTIFYIVMAGTHTEDGTYSVTGLPALVPVLFWFVYIVIAEQYLGGTLGHQIFKLKVVSRDDRKITFGQTFVRRICDTVEISWCFGFIAWLLVKNTDHNQRLGDLVAKTMVIRQDDPSFEPKFDFEHSLIDNP